jgi:hypothetical protein
MIMNNQITHFDWNFGLRWLLASAVGLLLGGMLAIFLLWGVAGAVEGLLGETAAFIVGGGLFGAVIALGASLGPGQLLQRHGLSAGRWIAASVIAGALGMAVTMAVVFSLMDMEAISQIVAGAVMGAVLGLSLGVGQWLVLARNDIAATEWPLVSVVAFVVGMMVGLPLGGENREWLSMAVIGLLVGAITALGMVWVLRREAAAIG